MRSFIASWYPEGGRDPSGAPWTTPSVRRLGVPTSRAEDSRFIALAWSSPAGPSHADVISQSQVTVGVAERAAVAPIDRFGSGPSASPLSRCAEILAAGNPSALRNATGGFACVQYCAALNEVRASIDSLGLERLFFMRAGSAWHFASRIELLAHGSDVDQEWASSFLMPGGILSANRTVWRDVRRLAPAELLRIGSHGVSSQRYWFYGMARRLTTSSQSDVVGEFRRRLVRGIRMATSGASAVWAELSGGLDSSSLVSIAACDESQLCKLRGTITVAHSGLGADESLYVNAVRQQVHLPFLELDATAPWDGFDLELPTTDEPRVVYPYYARQRRMESMLRTHGCDVLLSGTGADHYLTASSLHVADLIASGRLSVAFREALRVARNRRRSVWHTLYAHGIGPLLAVAAGRAASMAALEPPRFLTPFAAQAARAGRPPWPSSSTSASVWHGSVDVALSNLHHTLELSLDAHPPLERRYPFLNRDLLDFASSLTSTFFEQNRTSKWILRESVSGVLPEVIRTRQTKGFMDHGFLRTLVDKRGLIDSLARDSIIADVRLVDPVRLRNEIAAGRDGRLSRARDLLAALSLETWLRARLCPERRLDSVAA